MACYKAAVTELPHRADVVIVGGGFGGASTAWALRALGVPSVIVLERETMLGRFASGRSAGLGRQLTEDDDTSALTVRGAQLMRAMPGVWTPTGGVLAFEDAALADEYQARAQRLGVPIEVHGAELVGSRWPQLAGLRVARALWVPGDGVIDVAALLRTLLGATPVALDTPVVAVEPGPRPRVVTPRGAIEARVVVDAAGAWAGLATGDEPLASYKRHVFVLGAPAAAGAPWIWHLGTRELYLRPDGPGVLASPCDAARCEPGHQDPDLVGEEHLRRLLDDFAPELASAAITRRWACQRAFAPDRRMRIRRDPDRPWLVWAAGLGGHGATAAPAVGERAATAVVEALAMSA